MSKSLYASIVVILLGIIGWYFAQKSHVQNVQNTPKSATSSIVSIIKIGQIAIDLNSVHDLQSGVDQGGQAWRLNPVDVAVVDSHIYPDGLARIDDISPLIQKVSFNSKTGVAVYILTYSGTEYKVTVMQPVVGKNKIWVVSDIEYSK